MIGQLKTRRLTESGMEKSGRPVIIAGNWKMYKTAEQALAFIKQLIPLVQKATAQIYLAVPFTAIKPVADAVKTTSIVIGAQNMHDATEGAFTGEVAAIMLKEAGARFVILGHSERRRLFGETNDFINRKIKRAFTEGLQPILCVGETWQERQEGKTAEVLNQQLTECLADIPSKQLAGLIVAYEPIWAIGTDQIASPDQAQEAHQLCRQCLTELAGDEVAQKTDIIYGGSVKADNAHDLLNQPDVDGFLVGGASLSADSFSKIVNLN